MEGTSKKSVPEIIILVKSIETTMFLWFCHSAGASPGKMPPSISPYHSQSTVSSCRCALVPPPLRVLAPSSLRQGSWAIQKSANILALDLRLWLIFRGEPPEMGSHIFFWECIYNGLQNYKVRPPKFCEHTDGQAILHRLVSIDSHD